MKRCKRCGDRKPGDRVLMDRLKWGGNGKRVEEWATIRAVDGRGIDQLLMSAVYEDGGDAWQGDHVLWGCICPIGARPPPGARRTPLAAAEVVHYPRRARAAVAPA